MRWDEIVGSIATKDYSEDELNEKKYVVTGTRAEYGLFIGFERNLRDKEFNFNL